MENERGIIIVGAGHAGRGKHIAEEAVRILADNKKVLIIGSGENLVPDDSFEVNGIRYREKEKPKRKPMSPFLMQAMLFAEMAYDLSWSGTRPKPKERPNVNIVEEYGLIQQKKSKLSRSQRDWVVSQFEKTFEIVKS